MPTVKSFNDSSVVSLAYALGDGTTVGDFSGETFNLLPYTSEGFQMSKEPKMSTAIRDDRRPSNSKNTKGTASGAATVEFGAAPFVMDMLAMLMMNEWTLVNDAEVSEGTFLTDGELKQFMVVEKTTKGGPLATDNLYHERYFGTAMNDATIEFSDGELITLAMNFMSINASSSEAVAGADGLGGSITTIAKVVPDDYEIADSSNNLKSVTLRDSEGDAMQVVFSDLSLQIQNNVREQPGLGYEFAAGMGFGKVAATLSGEIYFVDQTLLDAHMQNKRLSAEFDVDTAEGTFTFYFPNLMVQAPTNNSEGENQDYKTSLTLAAEAGKVTIGAAEHKCIVAVKYVAK